MLVGVPIRFCGNGDLWFRSYSGSLLERPKSNPKAFAPPLGASPRLGMLERKPWRAANPASCRVSRAPKPAFGQRGFTGRRGSKAKAEAECGGLGANRLLSVQRGQMWELACLRWHPLGVPDELRCLHRRQTSAHAPTRFGATPLPP